MGPHKKPSRAKIRLVIASTLSTPALSLAHIIGTESGFEVVATISPETRSIDLPKDLKPDILLVEVDRHRREILRVVEDVQKQFTGLHTLVLLRHADDATVGMFLRAGVKGIVLKTANTTTLFDAVRAVHQGGRYVDAGLSEVVMNLIETGTGGGRPVELTKREQEVLSLIASGRTYKEIASALNVSVKTVETYRTRIGEKLQLHNRKALKAFAIANGYAPLNPS